MASGQPSDDSAATRGGWYYLRGRVIASTDLRLLRDVLIGVVAASIWWWFRGAGAAPELTEVVVGVLSATFVEVSLFIWRFIWTTPFEEFQLNRRRVLELSRRIENLASSRPIPTAKWVVDLPYLYVEVKNSGATALFFAEISTAGLADPDFSQRHAVWSGNSERRTRRLHRGASSRLAIGMIEAERWVLFARSRFGTTRSRSESIAADSGSPKFQVTVLIRSTPEAMCAHSPLSAVLTGKSLAVESEP
jgi:hypothetical protein